MIVIGTATKAQPVALGSEERGEICACVWREDMDKWNLTMITLIPTCLMRGLKQ
jgi:hypothetical protein